jgi:uncharacterized membrane protein HdeD (DUF308 family)
MRLFLIRGLVAIAWVAVFAAVSDSLTTGVAILVVTYPVIDLVASLIDAREQDGSARQLLVLNAGVSAVTAVAVAVAATGDIADVLVVLAVWAAVTGAAQIATAVRRRAVLGMQWPMLLAGALSVGAGISFTLTAADADPMLDPLVLYAATSGAFFVIQAALLARRGQYAIKPAGASPKDLS